MNIVNGYLWIMSTRIFYKRMLTEKVRVSVLVDTRTRYTLI